MSFLDGKPRVAEDGFGLNRATVELGMREFRAKILCVNDLSARRKPKAEEKDPKLVPDGILEPVIGRSFLFIRSSYKTRDLLDSVSAVLNRASNFIRKGLHATVHLLNAVYEKGIKICGKEGSKPE